MVHIVVVVANGEGEGFNHRITSFLDSGQYSRTADFEKRVSGKYVYAWPS